MSVQPGRGVPPPWLFLRFLPSFFFLFLFFYPVKRVFFSINMARFFLTWIEGRRTEDVIHCTACKAHWGNVIVILGYIHQIDLMYCMSHTQTGAVLSDIAHPQCPSLTLDVCGWVFVAYDRIWSATSKQHTNVSRPLDTLAPLMNLIFSSHCFSLGNNKFTTASL